MLRHLLCVLIYIEAYSYEPLRRHISHNSLFSRHRVLEAKKIALTREAGNNDKLTELLFGLNCLEIPCIQFFENSDVDRLSSEIKSNDIIVLTSPQGANVFLTHWGNLGQPNVKVAVVGTGTAQPLIIRGIKPVFQPSDFTGEALAKELPTDYGLKVLYPTSSLADNSLERGLKERGFQVTRINSYTTGPAIWSDQDIANAKSVDLVTFASPSAVRTWAERVGTKAIAVTIGPTSHKAALSAGFSRVYSPAEGSKGIEPWADLIRSVANESLPNI